MKIRDLEHRYPRLPTPCEGLAQMAQLCHRAHHPRDRDHFWLAVIEALNKNLGSSVLISFISKVRHKTPLPPRSTQRYRDILHEERIIDPGDSELRTVVAKQALETSIKDAARFMWKVSKENKHSQGSGFFIIFNHPLKKG